MEMSDRLREMLQIRLSGVGSDLLMPPLRELTEVHDLTDAAVENLKQLLAVALKEGCRVGLVEAQAFLLEKSDRAQRRRSRVARAEATDQPL